MYERGWNRRNRVRWKYYFHNASLDVTRWYAFSTYERKEFANNEGVIVLSYERKGLVLCVDISWYLYHGIQTSFSESRNQWRGAPSLNTSITCRQHMFPLLVQFQCAESFLEEIIALLLLSQSRVIFTPFFCDQLHSV